MVLPPEDVPLAPELPALVRAARLGDVGAMCRLSYELSRCTNQLALFRRLEARATDNLLDPDRPKSDPRSNQGLLSSLANTTALREKLETICAGVTPQPGLEPWRLLRDAARAGHIPSMIRFARFPPMDQRHLLADLDALDAYRAEAAVFLRRADAMGNPTAAYHLFWAYNGNYSLLERTGQITENPQLALAYALALRSSADERTQRILSSQEAKLRRKLSATDQQEAERIAAQLSLRYAATRGAGLELEQNSAMQSAAGCN